MTALRIDMKKFKEACEDVRYSMGSRDDLTVNLLAKGVRRFYEVMLDDGWRAAEAEEVVEIDPIEDLRSTLNVAARVAGPVGASQSQIDFIVFLAEKNDDYNVISNGRLTSAEASRIIASMKA